MHPKLQLASESRFPPWLHVKLPKGGELFKTGRLLQKYRLNTVCEEAKCPNRFECYSRKTATFLALGKACSRSCSFCDIDFAKQPKAPEEDEPLRIALSSRELGLKHVVVTMVARDDLPDGGAAQIAATIEQIRQHCPGVSVEVLTSDFAGNLEALAQVLRQQPEIFNHNIETVPRLTPRIRHKATYQRTLQVLQYAKESKQVRFVKSGLMVGLGEHPKEVEETIRDLHHVGCDIITIGQYLQADPRRIRVAEFVPPQQFANYEAFGRSIGVAQVYAGPFVRSSYNAQEQLTTILQNV